MTELEQVMSKIGSRKPVFSDYEREPKKLLIAQQWLLTEEIAKCLGGTVEYTEGDAGFLTRQKIVMPVSGIELSVALEERRQGNKVNVSTYKRIGRPFCDWSAAVLLLESETGRSMTTNLSASVSRGPEAIAKDINRRLLGDAALIVERAEKIAEKRKQDQERMDRLVNRVLKELPGSQVCSHSSKTEHEVEMWARGSVHNMRIYSYGPDQQHMSFDVRNVPVELGIEFLNKLAKAKG